MTVWIEYAGPLFPDVGSPCLFMRASGEVKGAVFGALISESWVQEFSTGNKIHKSTFKYFSPVGDMGFYNAVYVDGGSDGTGNEDRECHDQEVGEVKSTG